LTIRLKAALVAGVSLNVIAAWAGAAWGEEAAAAPATAIAATAAPQVGEVIVTAQRRDQSIQTVPMTIQAFGADRIRKLNLGTLDDLIKYTPNVVYTAPGAGQGQVFMRGLSTGRAGEQSYATVGGFPNVAVYLDEQSMQFPGRSPDIYLADMQRVEVLEGPQGTLFGGGAEAGALRYITNKPKLNTFEGQIEGMYGFTAHGDPNYNITAMVNLPVIKDKLAIRAVYYNDHQGGYIDNVPSTFTRNQQLDNNTYIGVFPSGGRCPNGGPPNPTTNFCLPAHTEQANNYALTKNAQNPVDTQGARVEVLWQINPDWNALITESIQNLNADGLSTSYPLGSDQQPLDHWEVTSFVPTYNDDHFSNTAWTLNGKIADLNVIYTGAFTDRYIEQQNDYTNYSRTLYGQYYECTGGNNGGFGAGPNAVARCYSPVTSWHDKVHNTHMSNELRVSTPSEWRLRGVAGAYFETFHIYDVMDFNYKTIPSCQVPANLEAALGPDAITCVGNDAPAPLATTNSPGVKGPNVGYGEDVTRGYSQRAFFAQLDFDIIPHVLTITAGTRHFDYNEYEKGSVYHTATNCTNILICPYKANIDAENLQASYHGFKSRFGIQWKPQDNLMFYYTYSQGFRPGGFNRYSEIKAPFTAGGSDNQYEKPTAYAPDSLVNNEIGMKTELFNRRLQLNITGYLMNWLDSQIALYQPCCLGNSTFTTNGASYNVKGFEVQFVALPTDGLTVQGSMAFNDNKQSNSPCLVSNVPTSPSFGQCIVQVKGQPYPNPYGVVGGIAAFSPKWKADMSLRYDWDIQDYHAFASIDGNYTSVQWNEPENYISGNDPSEVVPTTTYLRYEIPAYGTMGGSLGFHKDRWTVQVYATNLLNSDSATLISSGQFIKAEVPLRPRTVNMKVTESF
jgi:outer membrane receptor protein involved in Fe transport